MISLPLLKREIKANYKLIVIFAAVLLMYVTIIVYMFDPKVSDMMKGFEELMPEVMAAFGFTFAGATLVEFLSSYLFGFLLIIFPMIFEIILANKLVARYVDRGSMAYLLATPNKRGRIAGTQAFVLVFSLIFLIAFVFGAGVMASQILFPEQLDAAKYALLHFGVFCLHLAISGLGFFSSCLFNETKYSYALSAGLPIACYLIQMLANVGGKLENLKYATFFTLFNANGLVKGTSESLWQIFILAGAGILLYGAGIIVFQKRDLPL